MTPDAFEVQEYFNITKLPRWIVLKKTASLKYETRRYLGKRDFDSVSTYLNVFMTKEQTDRRETDLNEPLTKRMSHMNYELKKEDADPGDIRGSINYPDEIVILHVRDILTMDYPNLASFQKLYR